MFQFDAALLVAGKKRIKKTTEPIAVNLCSANKSTIHVSYIDNHIVIVSTQPLFL